MGSVGEFVAVRVRGRQSRRLLMAATIFCSCARHTLQVLHALRAAADLEKRCDACGAGASNGMFLAAWCALHCCSLNTTLSTMVCFRIPRRTTVSNTAEAEATLIRTVGVRDRAHTTHECSRGPPQLHTVCKCFGLVQHNGCDSALPLKHLGIKVSHQLQTQVPLNHRRGVGLCRQINLHALLVAQRHHVALPLSRQRW
jgi:hypothetical protein